LHDGNPICSTGYNFFVDHKNATVVIPLSASFAS
jgi:hypothetical protein